MYLQITTKCNMTCAHCCYNCSTRGKHGNYNTIIDAIAFAREIDDETIAIGGGEPTLHPQFFDILKHCLNNFTHAWMATNGSQTETMLRLANIINGEDYPKCTCQKDDPEHFDEYGCVCHEKIDDNCIFQEGKLSVTLSQDPFHDAISQTVINLWGRQANKHSYSHFEIRNVTHSHNGVVAQGRAIKTGSGWSDHCVCPDLIIRPDGKIKLCGCTKSPIIGDVWYGIKEKYENIIYNDENFQDNRCYKHITKG